MNLSEWLGVIALLITCITLLIVIYQTQVIKKSFDITNESFKKDKQLKELNILPKMHFVMHVQIQFEDWINNLKQLRERLELIDKNKNDKALEQISENMLKTSEGLVDKYYYDNAPNWLSEIYMSGAKHYYNSVKSLDSLWDKTEGEGHLNKIRKGNGSEGVIDKINKSIYHIKELNEYIKEAIPTAILNTPEEMEDKDFFGNK